MKETFLWVEKYRPKTIQDCVLPKNMKKTFTEFVKKGIPNLLLTGGAGRSAIFEKLKDFKDYAGEKISGVLDIETGTFTPAE